jgi:Porin subfamily
MHHASSSWRAVAVVAAASLLIAASGSGLVAQTLTGPNQRTPSPPPDVVKSPPAGKAKSCSAFGAGFVNVPGTDACVKIGGSVDAGVSASPGR